MGTFPAPIAVATSWCVCTTEFTSGLAPHDGRVQRRLARRYGRVYRPPALVVRVPLRIAAFEIGVDVDRDDVLRLYLVVRPQHGLDVEHVRARHACTDVPVEVHQPLMVEHVRTVRYLALQRLDLCGCRHGCGFPPALIAVAGARCGRFGFTASASSTAAMVKVTAAE